MIKPEFLLDTNCLIYLAESSSEPLSAKVKQYYPGQIITSAIAFGEFAMGIDWSEPDAESTTAQFMKAFPIVPFDTAAARAYALLPFRRGAYDRLIAAHVLALDLTLVTANPRDFHDIPGLRFEDWTQ